MNRLDFTAFDLIAIGSGPAGQRAAVQAARLGKRVALVERAGVLGGARVNTGTVPSKTLRAAIVDLTGAACANGFRLEQQLTVDDLLWRARQVIEREQEAVADELRRHGVRVFAGEASFVDPHTLELDGSFRLHGERIVIAVGTTPARPAGVEFDGRTVLDSDGILHLARLPRTLTVIGAGVIGLEYASMAAALGVRVTLVEGQPRILDFVDDELVETLLYHLRGLGLVLRLGDAVETVRLRDGGAVTRLSSGHELASDVVIHADARHGATGALNLAAADLSADERGRIAVGPDYRTAQPHVFAAGDVIGFPGLAASAAEQGRLATLAAFDVLAASSLPLLPFCVHTIPELSFVGPSERELTERGVPYVLGVARYRDLVRAGIAGDRAGLLKLLVHATTRRVLAVHIFGTSASELVHLGQTVMAAGLPVDRLAETVFNVPTFSDAYRVAALDAAGRLDALDRERKAA